MGISSEHKYPVLILIIVYVVVAYLALRFIHAKRWPRRLMFASVGFFILGFPASLAILSIILEPSNAGPGEGIVIFYPFAGIIAGYLIGALADFFKPKNPRF